MFHRYGGVQLVYIDRLVRRYEDGFDWFPVFPVLRDLGDALDDERFILREGPPIKTVLRPSTCFIIFPRMTRSSISSSKPSVVASALLFIF
jgi:hypothetical protein